MKGIMVKCLQCNTVSVYKAEHNTRDRCPICKGYVMPQGECNIVDERAETTVLYGDGEAIETICTQVVDVFNTNTYDYVRKVVKNSGE